MPIDVSMYLKHTKGRGLVEVLLRGHLWIEKHLTSLLEADLKKPEVLRLDRMPFSQKAKLAEALGLLSPGEGGALQLLNTMRNRLAHNLSGHPSERDIANLESSMTRSQLGLAAKIAPYYEGADEVDPEPDVRLARRLAALLLAFLTEVEQHSLWHTYWRKHQEAMQGYRLMVAVLEELGAKPQTWDDYRAALGIPDPPTGRDAILKQSDPDEGRHG